MCVGLVYAYKLLYLAYNRPPKLLVHAQPAMYTGPPQFAAPAAAPPPQSHAPAAPQYLAPPLQQPAAQPTEQPPPQYVTPPQLAASYLQPLQPPPPPLPLQPPQSPLQPPPPVPAPAPAAAAAVSDNDPVAAMRRSRDRRMSGINRTTVRAQPYERPEQARPTESVSVRHTHRSVSPVNQRHKRVSFNGVVVKTVFDKSAANVRLRICGKICLGCPVCEVKQELRDGHRARYYPTSATQQSLGRELTKVSFKRRVPDKCFCVCTDGCTDASSCACCREGIGCWWESWLDESGEEVGRGCCCRGACASGLPAHVYDGTEGSRARQAKLRGLYDVSAAAGSAAGSAMEAPQVSGSAVADSAAASSAATAPAPVGVDPEAEVMVAVGSAAAEPETLQAAGSTVVL